MRDLARGIELISAVAAPVSIVTALLVYVGWTRNRAYFSGFGIDQGVLGLSLQDYVLRSADVTFGAVVRLASVALLFVIVDRVLLAVLHHRWTARTARWIDGSLAVAGVVLAAGGLLYAVGLTGNIAISPFLGAALLALGAVLTLRFGPAALSRRVGPDPLGLAGTIALYTILLLALFWAATLYAQDLGRRAAVTVDANSTRLPLTTVFSDRYLDLPGSAVQATQVPGPANSTHFRYSGLALLTYSNNRWFLISGRYADGYRSSIVVLHDSDAIRVEISTPR